MPEHPKLKALRQRIEAIEDEIIQREQAVEALGNLLKKLEDYPEAVDLLPIDLLHRTGGPHLERTRRGVVKNEIIQYLLSNGNAYRTAREIATGIGRSEQAVRNSLNGDRFARRRVFEKERPNAGPGTPSHGQRYRVLDPERH